MIDTDKLLEEFPSVSRDAWEEAIRADLGDADYEKELIWQTPEKIAIKPYYRAEDLSGSEQGNGHAGDFNLQPLARLTGDWRIREEIDAADPIEANRMAREAIASGVEEIAFRSPVLDNASDLQSLCANLQPIPLHFEDATESLLDLLLQSSGTDTQSTISTGWNPLNNLNFAAAVLRAERPRLVPFTIHSEEILERGASAVEEVAYTLAAGIEFLREMQAREIDIDRAVSSIGFSFSIGASFIFQIAKFRAFRSLWAKVVSCYAGDPSKAQARIYARTSRWNKTIYDANVNMLRATTEAMSAAFGGVDSICVAPFDECYKTPNEASRRLARNTQLILKLEAMLGRVTDPAAGSYCIEVMTDCLARESWKYMQKIESDGGYTKNCNDGQLDELLKASEARQEKAVNSRQRILTGTNSYANAAERVLDRIEPVRAFDARRGAVTFERLRLRTERHAVEMGKAPHVLLAEFGDAEVCRARSRFAANFLACVGVDVEVQRFATASQIADANADLIVLCGSDRECAEMASDLLLRIREIGRQTPVIVAGNPESAERLRAEGVFDFIHLRSHPVDTLTKLQQRLGMMV